MAELTMMQKSGLDYFDCLPSGVRLALLAGIKLGREWGQAEAAAQTAQSETAESPRTHQARG